MLCDLGASVVKYRPLESADSPYIPDLPLRKQADLSGRPGWDFREIAGPDAADGPLASTTDDGQQAQYEQGQAGRLGHRRYGRSRAELKAAIGKGRHQVTAVEDHVAGPIALGPNGHLLRLVFSRSEDRHEVIRRKRSIEVGIAEPRFGTIRDPNDAVVPIDDPIVVLVENIQVLSRRRHGHGLQINIRDVDGTVLVVVTG